MRDCCHRLEIISLASSATQFTITVAQQPLIDGHFYSLTLRGLAFPAGVSGTEQVVIVMGPNAIVVGDCRARRLLAERINQCSKLCMQFTADSVAGELTTPPPVAAFLVKKGIGTPI